MTMSAHRFDLVFSGMSSGRSARLVALDPSQMDFIVGSGIRTNNAKTLYIRSDSITFQPNDGGGDVTITVYLNVENTATVLSFQLQSCQSLNWTLDDSVQETVGEGRFNVRMD